MNADTLLKSSRPARPRRWWRVLGWVLLIAWSVVGLMFLRSAMRPFELSLAPRIRMNLQEGHIQLLFDAFFPLPSRVRPPDPKSFDLPLWPFISSLLPASLALLWWTRPVFIPGRCSRCWYSTAGLKVIDPVGRVGCPECGLTQLPSGFVPRWATQRRRRLVRTVGWTLLLFGILTGAAQYWTREHSLECRLSQRVTLNAGVGLLCVEVYPTPGSAPSMDITRHPPILYWWVPRIKSRHEGLIVPCWVASVCLLIPAACLLWAARPASMGAPPSRVTEPSKS